MPNCEIVQDALKKIEIREYKHNKGIFALEHIYQGETILELPTDNYSFEPDKYSIQITPGLHLDCSNHPIRHMNHSCEPNASVRGDRIVAWACIEEGEQITIDYKKTENKLAVPFTCYCGFCNNEWIS